MTQHNNNPVYYINHCGEKGSQTAERSRIILKKMSHSSELEVTSAVRAHVARPVSLISGPHRCR